MEHQAVSGLVNLSLPIECLGLFMAWSDLQKWRWIKEMESFVDELAERRKRFFGGFSLGLDGLELIAIVITLSAVYFFGVKFDLSESWLVYGVSALLLVALPFFCHALNRFGKENSVGSVGILLACIGVAIEGIQKFT